MCKQKNADIEKTKVKSSLYCLPMFVFADVFFAFRLKVCKAVLVGDVAVGKSCLVNRFCRDVFDRLVPFKVLLL